jgi:acyl carrier protein/short-subunit dehydrogenase involved in D-alanine esterification of teichoic acids
VLFGPSSVISLEVPEIACSSIDINFENNNAGENAELVLAEILARSGHRAVAYRRGKRFIQATERLDLSAAAEHPRLTGGSTYLITGGLGDLGLAVAEHLAQEFKARLILIGRSPLPREEHWDAASHDEKLSAAERERLLKLIAIRDASGGLLVAQGDVTNLEQMRAIIAQAKEKFRTIDGVFHAAGVLDDGPLLLKTAASVHRVLAPKVRGTLVLEEALRGHPLQCFVLFSSISSIVPVAGQVDYAAANAFLDAFASSRKGPVIAINWDAWRETGMAARSPILHPMLETRTHITPEETVYASRFSTERMWMLAEHRLNVGGERKALLPGTGYLEMAAAAFSRDMGMSAVEFRDVYFLAPLLVDSGQSKEVRLQLKPEVGATKGAQRFSVFSQSRSWIEHATGIVARGNAQPHGRVDRAAVIARCQQKQIVFDEQHRTLQERQIEFGPRWRSLRRILLGHGEGVAEIELNKELAADVSSFRLHPALLDLATGAALYLMPSYEDSGDLFLPISYERAQFFQPLPARFFSHMRLRQQRNALSEIAAFDITLFDEQDQVLAEIEGFAMRRIVDPTSALLQNPSATSDVRGRSDVVFEDRAAGIATRDGVRALTTIMMSNALSSVIVTARKIEELTPATGSKSAASTLPVLPAVATPTEDVAATLALWWSELLGVNRIEPQDDFFLLGGHSLIGVRLLARIKKAYRVDLQLADLFEARTLQRIADAISAAHKPSATK